MTSGNPKVVVILSGKRKSGKDHFARILSSTLGCDKCDLVSLSAPLKRKYAQIHELDFERLLDSTSYKELYRDDMIRWGEAQRLVNPYVFCREASSNCTKPIWIVTDARRPTDIQYFQTHFPGKSLIIRIFSSDKARCERGWNFKKGVDDAPSECALDTGIQWDFVLDNTFNVSNEDLNSICHKVQWTSLNLKT